MSADEPGAAWTAWGLARLSITADQYAGKRSHSPSPPATDADRQGA